MDKRYKVELRVTEAPEKGGVIIPPREIASIAMGQFDDPLAATQKATQVHTLWCTKDETAEATKQALLPTCTVLCFGVVSDKPVEGEARLRLRHFRERGALMQLVAMWAKRMDVDPDATLARLLQVQPQLDILSLRGDGRLCLTYLETIQAIRAGDRPYRIVHPAFDYKGQRKPEPVAQEIRDLDFAAQVLGIYAMDMGWTMLQNVIVGGLQGEPR